MGGAESAPAARDRGPEVTVAYNSRYQSTSLIIHRQQQSNNTHDAGCHLQNSQDNDRQSNHDDSHQQTPVTNGMVAAGDNMTSNQTAAGSKSQNHPVLSILQGLADVIDQRTLKEFVDYQEDTCKEKVPLTLTKFFTEYVNFLLVRHMRYNRAQYAQHHFCWNNEELLDCLSKVAYLHHIHNVNITYNLLEKLLPSTKELLAGDHTFKPDMIFRTFGFMEIESAEHKRVTYRFRELCVEEYLVAHYLSQQCLNKAISGRHRIVTTGMRDCMRRLPMTGDILRMTFGLLNMKKVNTCEVQTEVLDALLSETNILPNMKPIDVTSLCVEIVYESQNVGHLAELLDKFTLNQSLNYSDAVLPRHRLPYIISAVGYVVRASTSVYGLHLSNMKLDGTIVALLADPMNEISDNNLQVLNLSNNSLGPGGMKRLHRFIVKATLLTHLDLASCHLGSVGVALLSEFFMCIPLQYLRLTDNQINDAAVKHISANLKYMPTLEWLDLAQNLITDSSAEHLAEALPRLTNLRSLDVRQNQISDRGAELITARLFDLNNITQLMLNDNQIGEEGAEKMAKHLWKTTSLRYLNLSLNNIPEDGILSLRRAASSLGSLHIEMSPRGPQQQESCHTLTATIEEEEEEAEAELNGESGLGFSNVDLLAGSKDTVQRRSHRSPRKDFRRSWHGMTGSLRNGYRRIEYK